MSDTYYLIGATYIADVVDGETVPPVTAAPMRWLYGQDCDLIDLDPAEWGDPDDDEYGLGLTVYTAESAGIAPREAWDLFAGRYGYTPEHSTPNMGVLTADIDGLPRMWAGDRWTDESHEWNVGGWSPILEVSVSAVYLERAPQ